MNFKTGIQQMCGFDWERLSCQKEVVGFVLPISVIYIYIYIYGFVAGTIVNRDCSFLVHNGVNSLCTAKGTEYL